MVVDYPLVSAVVPVYNGENYLREAIDSILNQTYPNIEIIVVNDGSTDSTKDIIESYGDKIRFVHKENGGATSALNCGIKAMNGEWFAWLSHDDLWDSTFIEKQIRNLQVHPDCMFSYSGFSNIDSDGKILNSRPAVWYSKGEDLRYMIVHGEYTYGITIVINRNCFEEVGLFDNRWRYVQDTDMWIRLFRKYNACYIPDLLAKRRVHPNQTGNKANDEFVKERKEFFCYYSRALSMSDYYPKLSDNKIPLIKKIVINSVCKFYYQKYVPFCYEHNFRPTIYGYVVLILGVIPMGHKIIECYRTIRRWRQS